MTPSLNPSCADLSNPDAIVNSSTNLQSTIEDFLESLSQSPDHALAELINCVLRCCGCSDAVNSDQVTDYDGIVDVLEDMTEALKNVRAPSFHAGQPDDFIVDRMTVGWYTLSHPNSPCSRNSASPLRNFSNV